MKKIFLMLLACSSAAYMANAQKSSAILKGGLNLANVSITDDGRVDEAKSLASFHVGLIGDFAIAKILSFQLGIVATGKGSKTQTGNETDPNYFKATSNPFYLEVPANLVFKLPITSDSKLFFGAGPYIAVGIAGKNKTEGNFLGNRFENKEDIDFSNDDPTTLDFEEGAGFGILKRFDYGLNGTAGLELNKVVLGVNYGLGLAKLQSGSNSSNDDRNKHRVLSFSVGVKL